MTAPTGTVTLVFTDVESSCALWEQQPDDMREALLVHDALMRRALAEHHGYEVKTEGDAFMVSFRHASNALAFCLDVQASLGDLEWPSTVAARGGLRVRMGAHRGTPHCVPNPVTGRMDYLGTAVNRAARIAALAHGGQILACRDTARVAGAPDGATFLDHGPRPLKGFARAVDILEVLPRWRRETLGPPRSLPPSELPSRAGGERDVAELLPLAAEGLLARGRVRALRGDAAARDDLRLAGDIALAAQRHDVRRRALLALLGVEVQLESRDVRAELETLLEDARSAGDRYVEARTLIVLARLKVTRMEDLEDVRAELDQALALARALGDPDIEAAALVQQGLLLRRMSRLDAAHHTLERALRQVEATGSRRHLGPILNGLSSVKGILGIADEALAVRAHGEALRSESAVDQAWALFWRGTHHLFAGHPTEALARLCEGRAAFAALGFEAGAWRSDLVIAIALASLGRIEEADVTIAAAAAANTGVGSSAVARGALHFHRAWVHLAAGRAEAARADAIAALDALAVIADHPLHRQSERLMQLLDSRSAGLPLPEAAGGLAGSLQRLLLCR